MMKIYINILAACLVFCATLSCEKWSDRQVFEGSGLGAVTKYYELPETASEAHVDVIATMQYDIRCDAEWLSVPASSQGRDGFNFTCQPNTGLTRQATILLAIDKTNHYDTLTVFQNGTTAIKTVSGVADGVGSIALNSQVESVGLSAEYHNGAADWITDTQIVGNDLTFAYLKNETAFPRFASIVITYKDAAGVSLKHRFDVLQSNSADSLQPSEDAFSDLTKDGKWANCYVLPDGQAAAYAVEVKHVSGEMISDKIRTAEILWETTLGTVNNLVYVQSDNKLYFAKPAGVRGNAVVALKDYNGNILWSYHVWASGEAVNDIKLGEYFFMDRNLGALANAVPVETENGTVGMFYQWGRKDPFPPAKHLKDNNGLISAVYPENAVVFTVAQNGVPVETTVANPNVFYWGNANKGEQDWSSIPDQVYWSTSAKTDYDPCPHGYVVPDVDQLTELTKDAAKGTKYSIITDDNGVKSYLVWGGWVRRKLADTHFAHVGQYPHLWSTTIEDATETGSDPKTDAEKIYNGAYATNTPTSTLVYPRRWGGNVRCVKVQSQNN